MNKKILIIDDNPDIKIVLGDILRNKGYEVITAEKGKEGLLKCRQERPSIALIDTRLEDFNGIELCRKIKQVEKLPVKVIVYTGYMDAIDAVKARENGADDYCVKTIKAECLLESIEKLTG
jgi:DNA-binding response OmpR family regulator